MQPPRSDICVICGINAATTTEHVPPRGFFKGSSGVFRTVPACASCNNGSSSDDEELRLYISAQLGKETDATKRLWEEGALKSVNRSKKLQSKLTSTLREVSVDLPDGEITHRLAFNISVDLYQRVFERVTRGLFFWHTRHILPRDISVKVELLQSKPLLESPELKSLFTNRITIADGAFEYTFAQDSSNNYNSIWIFGLHQMHWIYATTGNISSVPS